MIETKRKYDSTIARIAGNIASGYICDRDREGNPWSDDKIAEWSVYLARAIVAEVERTDVATSGESAKALEPSKP